MKEILMRVFAVVIAHIPGVVFPGDYENGFESGLISEEEWQIDIKGECQIETTQEIVRKGKYSALFKSGPGARCEILPKLYHSFLADQLREPFGEDRWYQFSVYLPDGWEPNEENEVVAQWHSSKDVIFFEKGGRGPPLALRIVEDRWRLTYGWDADLISKPGRKAIYPLWVEKLETGKWIDWVFRVRWSYKEDGLIEVWKNGLQIVKHVGPNTYNDIRGVYWKIGSYHPGQKRSIYLDEVKVGSSLE